MIRLMDQHQPIVRCPTCDTLMTYEHEDVQRISKLEQSPVSVFGNTKDIIFSPLACTRVVQFIDCPVCGARILVDAYTSTMY